MPSFDFVHTIVSAFVLVFLLANIVLYVIDIFKEGFEGETVETAAPQIDYASQISTDMSDLFEKVNKQLDITKTLKIPLSTDSVVISYNRNLATNMLVYGNLLTLVNDGIMRVEDDLKNVQTYQYIGNSSVQKMSEELAKINESSVNAKCNTVESFSSIEPFYSKSKSKSKSRASTLTTTAPLTAAPYTTAPAAPSSTSSTSFTDAPSSTPSTSFTDTPSSTSLTDAPSSTSSTSLTDAPSSTSSTSFTDTPTSTSTAPTSTSTSTAPAYVEACLRKNEYDIIKRVKVIVDSHQITIDKILEKRASS